MEKDEILKIARLSRIRITDDELPQISRDLAQIFDHVQNIKNLDTNGIEPLFHPSSEPLIMRKDRCVPQRTEDLLKNAPELKAKLFVVPKVVEK